MNESDLKARMKTYVEQSNSVSFKTFDDCNQTIFEASVLLTKTLQNKNKIMICGNGGSSSDASHLAAEFTNRFLTSLQRPGLAAISLSADSTFLTAHSNDFSFETIFSKQIEALGNENDTLIAITTSGKSKNIVKAVHQAKKMNINIITLTGDNDELNDLSDITINVKSENTQHIQETMIQIEHLLIYFVEAMIYKL